MFRFLKVSIAFATAVLIASSASHAARDLDVSAPEIGEFQMIVLEAPGCIYCKLFRRDVEPTYNQSKHSKTAPLRYLDVNTPAFEKLDLNSPVTIIPTVVLIKDDREVSRIPGYIGPENFFHSVKYMFGQD